MSYTFGPGIDWPISMYRDNEIYYYHSDALGSIYQMTNSNQDMVRSYDYSAFGKIISQTGTVENPFTYTGRERDEDSGLYFYRFRYYDPEVGRFLNRDPIGYLGGVNLYVYVENNPIMAGDPLGLVPFPSCGRICAFTVWLEDCYQCCDDECTEDRVKETKCMDACAGRPRKPIICPVPQ